MTVRSLLLSALWLLPASGMKNRMLRAAGHDLHPTAIARCNFVRNVGSLTMGPNSRVAAWNVIKDLSLLELGDGATIGRFNRISAHPVFRRLYPDGARLVLHPHSYVTSRHALDCSGSVAFGEFACLAGHSTQVLTHSIDLKRDAQTAYPITIGPRSFVGTGCVLLGGAELPMLSVLAAGSVLTRAKEERSPGLWAGAPATRRGEISGDWFGRKTTGTRRVYVPSTGETIEDAF